MTEFITNTEKSLKSTILSLKGGAMNKVFLIGRLTADPVCKYTPTQMAIMNMTLAIDRNTKEKKTDFPRVTVYGKQAENCEKYLKKGMKVAVEGHLETSSYKKGEDTIFTMNVSADRVEFIEWADEEKPDFSKIDGDIPF